MLLQRAVRRPGIVRGRREGGRERGRAKQKVERHGEDRGGPV